MELMCQECYHDIDNHSYNGCLVKGCKCRSKPSEIAEYYLDKERYDSEKHEDIDNLNYKFGYKDGVLAGSNKT